MAGSGGGGRGRWLARLLSTRRMMASWSSLLNASASRRRMSRSAGGMAQAVILGSSAGTTARKSLQVGCEMVQKNSKRLVRSRGAHGRAKRLQEEDDHRRNCTCRFGASNLAAAPSLGIYVTLRGGRAAGAGPPGARWVGSGCRAAREGSFPRASQAEAKERWREARKLVTRGVWA